MNVVLDAGAFVAIERRDRKVGAMLRLFQIQNVELRTSAAVVAQVWRDGRKQARLARVLQGVRVRGLVPGVDRQAGELLAKSGTSDVVDAHLALMVEEDDQVLTSDPEDVRRLLDARRVEAAIVKT